MKVAVGTVQFGADYGAFNATGQVGVADVAAILDLATAAGIDLLDCARAYGTAEDVLGASNRIDRFRVVTKCPSLSGAADPVAALRAAFHASCTALGVTRVEGYLLHNIADLAGPYGPALWHTLEGFREQGLVERIGVSAYNIAEAKAVAETYPITLVQLPANVLIPWYKTDRLPENIEVHVRSAFLQGFLLCTPETLAPRFAPWRQTLVCFREQAAAQGLSPVSAALAPLLHSDAIDRVVVGVDSASHLEEIIRSVRDADGKTPVLGPFPKVTDELIDPRKWFQ
ncbi:aldo/keto reductase family protein (plasmid) [Pseudosulfitobacter pseudonitzschiae]|uniref:Aldo/keto reductase family protein n=1 Tax=Pseudosulfitobacter pseudonitzschiae TaxID=1402135 RepID=A0A221K6X7_9RHOB|nr:MULTISPECIES: aldo/keto reductase [Roseobacteraceae]ASM74623.1 aldo/keto reductase family protein [Pseudosulfitobacter pseudonitzschiae]